MRKIDINTDIGEGFGPYKLASDSELLQHVTSANIACGFHAGDPQIMLKTIKEAQRNNVLIGAHIGYPDIQGFGRRDIKFSLDELYSMTLYQLGALTGMAKSVGASVTYANFHGALGNLSFRDNEVAKILISAIKDFDSNLIYVGIANTCAAKEAESQDIKVMYSFLADRGYTSEGVLAKRGTPNAVIKDLSLVEARVKKLLKEGIVETVEGNNIKMEANSILVHSDTSNSLTLAKVIEKAIVESGCITSFS
ncbi:LamB/YcsF family protein [Marinomonas sp.]|nr:5-oxoprolinase subunit PxpA [Marinomonas sp.]MDB4837524.1 LamB/YcsF family protein [Marinomonas sp.]